MVIFANSQRARFAVSLVRRKFGVMSEAIPVFILADNQFITREGISATLRHIFRLASTVTAASRVALVESLRAHPDAVVVLDYALFDFRSVDALRVLLLDFPQARWVLFSDELSTTFIRVMSAEPAVSILFKDCPGEEVVAALERAALGEKRYLCHQVADMLATDTAVPATGRLPLTPSETEVLKLIAMGRQVKEIADARNSSIHTIVTHKKNIFRKLGVNTVYEATKYALRAGLVDLVEYYI